MSTFVLVHGAWHGGWVWDKVAESLRQHGHTVLTPDLPGHGSATTPIAQISLQAYVDRVAAVIDSCREPVVLAGHSMSGMVISQVAEERPDRIWVLVYVCAFLPQDGQCLLQWAEADSEATVPKNFVFAEDKASVTLRPEGIGPGLYGDCEPEEIERISKLLVPQATAPLTEPVRLTREKFGQVPRVYIECLRDRAISLGIQREMYVASKCDKVFTLDCDHSPMVSRPQELVGCLLAATKVKREVPGKF